MDSNMKKLLFLLPLLLAGCSGFQMKQTEPKQIGVIRYQQPVDEGMFDELDNETPVNAFRCFNPGQVEGEEVRADVLRNIDKGAWVTVYFVHNGYHFSTDGILLQLTTNGKIKLEEHVLIHMLGKTYPLTVNSYVDVKEIEYVLIDASKELQ